MRRILDLVDGQRSIAEICQQAELPLPTGLAVMEKLCGQDLVRVPSVPRRQHQSTASLPRRRVPLSSGLVLALVLAVALHLILALLIFWLGSSRAAQPVAARLLDLELVSPRDRDRRPLARVRQPAPDLRRRAPRRASGGASPQLLSSPGVSARRTGRGLSLHRARPAAAVAEPRERRPDTPARSRSAALETPANPGNEDHNLVPTPIFDLPENKLSTLQRLVLKEVRQRRDERLRALALRRQRARAGVAPWMREGARLALLRPGVGRGQGGRAGRGGGQDSPLFGVTFSVSARRVKDSPVTRRPALIKMPPVRCGAPSRELRPAVIKTLVDRKGGVLPHRFVQRSGNEDFDTCALSYVKGLRFKPGADCLGRKLNVWIYVKVEPGTLLARPSVALR